MPASGATKKEKKMSTNESEQAKGRAKFSRRVVAEKKVASEGSGGTGAAGLPTRCFFVPNAGRGFEAKREGSGARELGNLDDTREEEKTTTSDPHSLWVTPYRRGRRADG